LAPVAGLFVKKGGVSVASSSVRSLCFSAFRAGSLAGLLLRPSRRAPSGRVLVCVFVSPVAAGRFAGLWAGRLGVSVAVRRHPLGAAVSVPVSFPSSRWPLGVGRLLSWSGGLRGFVRCLAWSGLGVL